MSVFLTSEHPPMPGYEQLRLLGRNLGIVYLARQSSSGQLVALKVVNKRSQKARAMTQRCLHLAITPTYFEHST